MSGGARFTKMDVRRTIERSGEYGPAIAQIATSGSSIHTIGQIIRRMKTNLAARLCVEELAAMRT